MKTTMPRSVTYERKPTPARWTHANARSCAMARRWWRSSSNTLPCSSSAVAVCPTCVKAMAVHAAGARCVRCPMTVACSGLGCTSCARRWISSAWPAWALPGGADMAAFFNATRSPKAALHVGKRLLRHGRDLLLHRRGLQLVNGNALVARLLRSALDLGVTLLTDKPASRLLGEGRVSGALFADGQVIHARRGVVLACGGFPHDRQRIAQLMPHAPGGDQHYSAAPRENSGDGLRLGEQAGGLVPTTAVHSGAWAPVSRVPRRDGGFGHFPHLIDRAKPGFIAVRRDGRRFVNEADCYHDFMNALFAATPQGERPEAWLICDHTAQRRYGIGWAKPFPFPTRFYQRSGYLHNGATLAQLAQRCGIDAAQLQRTVEGFNQYAAQGRDPAFQRGVSAYNQAQGEPQQVPNPSLRPLLKGPFYAVKLLPGSLGTFAGLGTDASARVLGHAGQPIPGLFAVGNDMHSVMGGHYPSGGITLGPGMTFGYLAGRALSGLSSI